MNWLSTLLGMLLGNNKGAGAGIVKSALGMANSARNTPQVESRQM